MRTNITKFFIIIVFATFCMNVAAPVVFAANDGGAGSITPGGSGGIKNPLQGSSSITDILKRVINWMLGLVGFLALIALITGGARMIIDFGNEEQVKKAKATILWAVIGLAVVILSYAIINIVTSEILGTDSGGGPSAQQQYDADPGTF